MRDLAWIGLGVWAAAVAAIAVFWLRSHWVSGRSVTQLVATGTLVWAYPLYRSIRTLRSNKESISLDVEAGVVRSGLRLQHESPLSRVCPLDVVTVGGSWWDAAAQQQRYTTPTYHVVARGWHNYVVYRSFLERRARARCRRLRDVCGCVSEGVGAGAGNEPPDRSPDAL